MRIFGDREAEERWLWARLMELAQALGVQVSLWDLADEEFTSSGGLCRVSGEWRCLLHRGLPMAERNRRLALALGRFDLESVHMPPRLRRYCQLVASRAESRDR